jgi:hypothetical protein
MFGLITMLLTTLGATGMGSILKMVGGLFAGIADAKAAAAQRELARDLALSNASKDLQKAMFGEANAETSMFTRATRRIIALIGMLNFFVISILCTIWPGVELITFTPPENKEAVRILWGLVTFPSGADITTTITTGHIALVSIATLGAIIGFYFTHHHRAHRFGLNRNTRSNYRILLHSVRRRKIKRRLCGNISDQVAYFYPLNLSFERDSLFYR